MVKGLGDPLNVVHKKTLRVTSILFLVHDITSFVTLLHLYIYTRISTQDNFAQEYR